MERGAGGGRGLRGGADGGRRPGRLAGGLAHWSVPAALAVLTAAAGVGEERPVFNIKATDL